MKRAARVAESQRPSRGATTSFTVLLTVQVTSHKSHVTLPAYLPTYLGTDPIRQVCRPDSSSSQLSLSLSREPPHQVISPQLRPPPRHAALHPSPLPSYSITGSHHRLDISLSLSPSLPPPLSLFLHPAVLPIAYSYHVSLRG